MRRMFRGVIQPLMRAPQRSRSGPRTEATRPFPGIRTRDDPGVGGAPPIREKRRRAGASPSVDAEERAGAGHVGALMQRDLESVRASTLPGTTKMADG